MLLISSLHADVEARNPASRASLDMQLDCCTACQSLCLPDACSSHQFNCVSPAASPLGRVSGGSPTSSDDELWRASLLAEQGGLRRGPSRDRSGGVSQP